MQELGDRVSLPLLLFKLTVSILNYIPFPNSYQFFDLRVTCVGRVLCDFRHEQQQSFKVAKDQQKPMVKEDQVSHRQLSMCIQTLTWRHPCSTVDVFTNRFPLPGEPPRAGNYAAIDRDIYAPILSVGPKLFKCSLY
jgi:hypothetical protein